MDIFVQSVPPIAKEYQVKAAIAIILHDNACVEQQERPLNFELTLNAGPTSLESRNDGTGHLIIPDLKIAKQFLAWVKENPLILTLKDHTSREHARKLRFSRRATPQKHKIEMLHKVPFIPPNVQEEHRRRKEALNASQLELEKIQIGTFKTVGKTSPTDVFSVEWERAAKNHRAGLLSMAYDQKVLGDPVTEEVNHSIVLKFSNISRIYRGVDVGTSYLCFDLITPAVFETEYFNRTITGDTGRDNRKFRERVGYLDSAHQAVAHYAFHLRVVLFRETDLQEFEELCSVADLRRPTDRSIDARSLSLFGRKTLLQIEKWLRALRFNVAFQVEALLRNAILDTQDLLGLRPMIDAAHHEDSERTAAALRSLNEVLGSARSGAIPLDELFSIEWKASEVQVKRKRNISRESGLCMCYHVTFTPTRTTLEGPYASQSNRVIRDHFENQENFVRVDFRDEDKLQYRWDREVDGASFLQNRVGKILQHGFTLAGRDFEFLAYSQSALREHAVWFLSPFEEFSVSHGANVSIDADLIRKGLGDFSGVLKQPSKYAARMAQNFTATDPSVGITRDQWCEIDDLGEKPYEFTDGVGTISTQLADMIWSKLCESRREWASHSVKPTAFQIRFLGYKGMVAIDPELKGVKMCLRPSMNKYKAHESESNMIEIAKAFERPGPAYLNRPLVAILEDRGVAKEKFLELQNLAIAHVRTSMDSVKDFRRLLSVHGLGQRYGLQSILNGLSSLGFEFNSRDPQRRLDMAFISRLGRFAMNHVLRAMKHNARIQIPNSYLLVGVADEGPAYVRAGHDNVYCIPEGYIHVCVQGPEDQEPLWLRGNCVVTRSPAVHPGDVQSAYACGEPPKDKLCLFRDLKNVVIFSSQGKRSLPSMLGGGDLDGDLYSIIKEPSLFPVYGCEPATYEPALPEQRDTDSTIKDVCDFIVEYINSDVLGLLSTNHLIIADQSKDGVYDERCLELARLCSLAVDYPKSGRRVDIQSAPRFLTPYKPDWQNAEVQAPRDTDYYESTRALGLLYRNIHLLDVSAEDSESAASSEPHCEPSISPANNSNPRNPDPSCLSPGLPIPPALPPGLNLLPFSEAPLSQKSPPPIVTPASPQVPAKNKKRMSHVLVATGLPSVPAKRTPPASSTRAWGKALAAPPPSTLNGTMNSQQTRTGPSVLPLSSPGSAYPIASTTTIQASTPLAPPGLSIPILEKEDFISTAIRDLVKARMPLPKTEQPSWLVHSLFSDYVAELRYICVTHSLSNHADSRSTNHLMEEEVVIGTILAKCSQHRHRTNRIYRMILHSGELVSRVKEGLIPKDLQHTADALRNGLMKAWESWNLSIRREGQFGAASFGLIALNVLFETAKALDDLESARKSPSGSSF